jgi:predicted dehydrogenase
MTIVESDPERRIAAKQIFHIPIIESYLDLDLSEVDFCVIATRPNSHLKIGEFFITNKIPCLLPKPVTSSLFEAMQLDNLAKINNTKVFTDYTYLYSDLLDKMKIWFDATYKPESYMSYRTSLGIIQSDVSVIEDLGSHDIANLIYLTGALPTSVQAIPLPRNTSFPTSDNFFSLSWNGDFTANVIVSWRSPKKMRNITIMAAKEALVLDELSDPQLASIAFEPDFQKMNSDSLINYEKRNISYSMGQIRPIAISKKTPLENEFDQLADFLLGNSVKGFICSEGFYLSVWKVLDALKKSNESDGKIINVT